MKKDVILKKLNTIKVITERFTKNLRSLKIKSISVNISVYHAELSTTQDLPEEYQNSIDDFLRMIETLKTMLQHLKDEEFSLEYVNILKKDSSEIERIIKAISYKILAIKIALARDTSTEKGIIEACVDLNTANAKFIDDLKTLEEKIDSLHDNSEKYINQLR